MTGSRVLLLSDARGPSSLPHALTSHGQHLELAAWLHDAPAGALADLAAVLGVDAVVVDARANTNLARLRCRQLATTATISANHALAATNATPPGRPAIIALFDERGLACYDRDWGADDFVMSTTSATELDMRVHRATARAATRPGTRTYPSPAPLVVGPLVVDLAGHSATLAGRTLALTHREFALLAHLARAPEHVFTREELLRDVWHYRPGGATRTVDVHIRCLRAKLGSLHNQMIHTVRNTGYRMVCLSPDTDQGHRPRRRFARPDPIIAGTARARTGHVLAVTGPVSGTRATGSSPRRPGMNPWG
jgi:DNA-binding winged helix-turn-helix (wHTH) protein